MLENGIPDSEEAVCFIHTHLAQVLQLASSTSAVAVMVQQNRFYLGMHNHCFPVICFVSRPLLTPYTLRVLNRKAGQIPSSVPQNRGK